MKKHLAMIGIARKGGAFQIRTAENKKEAIEPKKCPDCDGFGEYSFPESSGVDKSNGWYKCETCNGTGEK